MSVLLGSEVSELALERAKLSTCFGGLDIRVAQMGFAAQATYWSAVDLHKVVMTNICEALNRPTREVLPEIAAALAAKTDLVSSGVAVDEHARVAIENEASKFYEASPWVADMRAEIVRPAPVQTENRVPPKSRARDMAFAKLQSRILSATEAVQAAKLHSEMLPEQQAILLSAGGLGTGTCWTAMHKSPTELPQDAQWRMATALRLGATPDAGPRSTCALRKGNDGDLCVNSLWQRTRSSLFAANTGEPETGHIAQSRAHCAGSSSRWGATQTWSAMSLSSTTGCKRTTKRHPRCGAPSRTWSPGARVSCSSCGWTSACDARMQNVTTKVRRNQG